MLANEADEDADGVPSPEAPAAATATAAAPAPTRHATKWETGARAAAVGTLAVPGVLFRVLLDGAVPPGQVDYLASQFLGSFVLGGVDEMVKRGVPVPGRLHLGIATGLCGSWTTFSSWQVDVGKAALGLGGGPASQGGAAGQVYAFFADLLIGIAVPVCGLYFGRHLVAAAVPSGGPAQAPLSLLSPSSSSSSGDVTWCVLFVVVMTAVALGAGFQPNSTSFSLLLAPWGALLRYTFSLHLNSAPLSSSAPPAFFPGTFLSNVMGSAILAGTTFVQLSYTGLSPLACAGIDAVGLGFCGSLTTVSTFVKELVGLSETRFSYVYGFTSVLVSQVIVLVVLGAQVATYGGAVAGSCTPPSPVLPGNCSVAQ